MDTVNQYFLGEGGGFGVDSYFTGILSSFLITILELYTVNIFSSLK